MSGTTWAIRVVALTGLITVVGACAPDVQADPGCTTPPEATVSALEQAVTNGGTIRFPHLLAAPGDDGRVFVSFENRDADQVEDDRSGHILTLVAPSPESTDFRAVDERARDETDLPAADIDVRADGAVTSRGCVLAARQAS